MDLRKDQSERYSRQMVLPNVGEAGQKKLLSAKVLVIGTGGLGSPCSIYLAAAGIGTLGIVDSDILELHNLHRQILHTTNDVGRFKVDSAKDRLNAINSDVEIVIHKIRLTAENIFTIINGYDIVADCSDNFLTRYLINDACVILKKPLSHGSVFRFDGQVITIIPGQSPCYRCLYREPSPPTIVPGIMEAGIFGVLPGIVGSIQAAEVLKYILGVNDLLTGKLLTFNILDFRFKQLKVPQDPKCPVCGDNPTIIKL
jgi:molybdopterin/thiamine biosynthesis adenylyltransferase